MKWNLSLYGCFLGSNLFKHHSKLETTLSYPIEASQITTIIKAGMQKFFNNYQDVLLEEEIKEEHSENMDKTDTSLTSKVIIGFVIGDTLNDHMWL